MLIVRRLAPLLSAAAILALTGCAATPQNSDDRLNVVASIYPLQYVVEQVGGTDVAVSTMTPAGSDPHSVELSTRQLRTVSDADVLIYLSGFQPAVDDAVEQRQPAHVLDVAQAADLLPLADATADNETDESDTHDGAVLDPHFWLDPTRLAVVGHRVAQTLADVDPDNATAYADRADALEADLTALDDEYRTALATCAHTTVVTSHAAFGYLVERYGLQQVAVSGIDAESEPSPARLREIRDIAAAAGATTVFTEPLADPSVAETLATDLDITVAQLNPLDSHSDGAPDYGETMRSNLAALQTGLDCS